MQRTSLFWTRMKQPHKISMVGNLPTFINSRDLSQPITLTRCLLFLDILTQEATMNRARRFLTVTRRATIATKPIALEEMECTTLAIAISIMFQKSLGPFANLFLAMTIG